ncbi:hypothetical protein OJ996_25900 [Luteolibacter sp. GHJ8]|uniref:Uncharacterized protein n=1 Tax=Luteolibacter rhizosphaerae TaxID=2989719 RepID=A0ABT3GB41_9BACT|nr:hypothetical protein [Luteolibacter rhizosphaerae]MCW1917050.1 hypothetical protein [Luteolibacter rhizosphaerae]
MNAPASQPHASAGKAAELAEAPATPEPFTPGGFAYFHEIPVSEELYALIQDRSLEYEVPVEAMAGLLVSFGNQLVFNENAADTVPISNLSTSRFTSGGMIWKALGLKQQHTPFLVPAALSQNDMYNIWTGSRAVGSTAEEWAGRLAVIGSEVLGNADFLRVYVSVGGLIGRLADGYHGRLLSDSYGNRFDADEPGTYRHIKLDPKVAQRAAAAAASRGLSVEAYMAELVAKGKLKPEAPKRRKAAPKAFKAFAKKLAAEAEATDQEANARLGIEPQAARKRPSRKRAPARH